MKTPNITEKRKKTRKSLEDLSKLKEQQKLLYIKHKREERIKKFFSFRLYRIFKASLIIALILTMIYIALLPMWKLNPFIFNSYPNKNLIIQDNLIVKDQKLINSLRDINVGNSSIFFFNPDVITERLKKLEPVQSVQVKKYLFPNRIKIIVTEKRPLFMIYKNSINTKALYAITNDGSIIPNKYFPLPEYYNKNTYNLVISKDQKDIEGETLKDLYKMIQIAEASSNEKLLYLDITNTKDIKLRLSNMTLRLGDQDAMLINRLKRLKAIINDIKPILQFIEYVDLRWDEALSLKVKLENKNSTFDQQIKFKTTN